MSMRLCCVAVRDLAVQAYMRPFFVAHPAQAIRSFMDEVKRKDGDMGKHKADYELYELGWFYEESGKFENNKEPRCLIRAIDVKEDA